MNISEATLDDIEPLCDLLALLFAQEAEFQPDREKQRTALRAILTAPEVGRILVWRDAESIRGMANLLFTVSTAKGGKVAILDDFIVHPDHRRNGIGTKLLDATRALCERENCHRIALQTDIDNQTAQRLYQRHGYSPSTMLSMILHLKNQPNPNPPNP